MRFVLKLLAVAIAILAPSAASAVEINCNEPNIARTSAITANTNTTSMTAVNITGATVTNVFPTNNSCVYVEYTGQFKATQGARITLVVTGLSNTPVVFPTTNDIATVGAGLDTKRVVFQLRQVAACSCTFQVKIQSLKSGQTITVGRGILRVLSTEV